MGGENLNKSTSDAGEAWSNMAASVEAEKNVAEKRAEVTEKAKKNSTLKKFVLGAVFALGVMTMVGCGKDGDASAVSEPTPSVSIEYNTPTPSYEINDDDEDGNSAYNPGEITVIDGEQDGGDDNDDVDVEPGGDGGEVEAGVDRSAYWEGDTFHLDEYARDKGFADYHDGSMKFSAGGVGGVGYILLDDFGNRLTFKYGNDTLLTLQRNSDYHSDTSENKEFLGLTYSTLGGVSDISCDAIDACTNSDEMLKILDGNIPSGWHIVE